MTPTPGAVRVRLVNDFEVVVAGLRTMLEPFGERVHVIDTEVGGTDLSDVPGRVDVTLFDSFGKPQSTGDAIAALAAQPSTGALAVYSWNMHPQLVERALDQGARGYLDKALDATELVGALERLKRGERPVISSTMSGAGGARSWPGREVNLSEREAEIMTLITQGFTNAEIAARLFLTVNSVKTYIRSAYRKIGVERRAQAVRWGLEHEMLPPESSAA